MTNEFDKAMEWVLRVEGGYSDHPADRGGPTKYGITQTTYDAWRRERKLEPRHVSTIEIAEARGIYHERYWTKSRCGDLPWPVSLVQFDSCVQHGVRMAARFLQEIAGVWVDGVVGAVTVKAVRELADRVTPREVADRILWRRARYYASIVAGDPSQVVFLRGWISRLEHLRLQYIEQ
jgi:lysozyme family protein